MNDRELLEMAAKAAGYELKPHPNHRLFSYLVFVVNGKNWNPLTDDGDALRLAVKLQMAVEISNRKLVWVSSENFQHVIEIKFDEATDQYAATRRAIVRAAAEIGKTMP